MIRGRHVRRRGQHEIDRLVDEPRQLPGIAMDQPRLTASATSGDVEVLRDELDADRPPSHPLGHRHGRAVAREGVEDELSGLAGVADDGRRQRLGEVDVVRRALRPLGHEVRSPNDERRIHATSR